MYNLIIRPLLFCIDPEKVHRMLLSWLKFYRYLFPVRACVRGYSRSSGYCVENVEMWDLWMQISHLRILVLAS